MIEGILLSATYQNGKIILKFYNPELNKLILWKDDYEPYVYVNTKTRDTIREIQGITSLTEESLFNIIKDKEEVMIKVKGNMALFSKDSQFTSSYKCWETDIRMYQGYLYDKGLIVGSWYNIHDDKIVPLQGISFRSMQVNLDGIIEKEKFTSQVKKWADLLDEPIPKLRRMAFDIEVESSGTMPDVTLAEQRVTAISFHSEDRREVFLLIRPEINRGETKIWEETYEKWGAVICQEFESEKEMLERAFQIIESYPIILTYNGDMFDMPYLYNRAIALGIQHIPFRMMTNNATLNHGIHIDMYGIFKNRSLKIYAFKSKYVEDSLDSVSRALLGEGKIEYDGELEEIPLYLLAKYCYNDSRLTYELSHFNNDLVINLIVILARIGNMPIDDISRMAISNWIKSLLYFTHRINGELIPRSDDFPQVDASTKSVGDKKYEGAIVLEPTPGIHFDVKVLDFASLYPSIIKTKNISYETVCCGHKICQANKIPQTKHWTCTKKTGIVSMLIGSLKELRVGHFKALSKSTEDPLKKQQYETISEALKVFLNASYGVIGFAEFPLYFLPTAEAVTAYGREIIKESIKKAREFGIQVIAGDTDSIFCKNPTNEQISNLISYTKNDFNIELEQDKEYRYVVLSNRKKNYFGIKKDGTSDIKGLSGKKSNTPPFLRQTFNTIVETLRGIQRIEDFEGAKQQITHNIKSIILDFDNIPLEDIAFKVLIQRDPADYKVKPLALKAAEQLPAKPVKGQFVQFVKTWNEPGVKPIQIVQRKDIDRPRYIESVQNTLQQICEPLDIDMESIISGYRKTRIEDFWCN